ncbi:hypothetical protein SKAU_G00198680 [Synaphobranchus kaupii]|uniref:Uncharacterized protein n=1 Tax=Synaphobranchus kaupii TaxID=118154 RepID=A0A9Q1FF46_SYNKA|nr:hypothetical protein SKAU_G00198680 [Synaphobranchus kaupii]
MRCQSRIRNFRVFLYVVSTCWENDRKPSTSVPRYLNNLDLFLHLPLWPDWRGLAWALLRRTRGLGYDRHLFLMTPGAVDFSGLMPFYNSVLQAWYQTLRLSRGTTCPEGWVLQEPLVHNPMLPMGLLQSINIQTCLHTAGVTKLGDLVCGGGWRSASELARVVGMRSTRLMQQLLEGIHAAIPASLSGTLQRTFHLGPALQTHMRFLVVLQSQGHQDPSTGANISHPHRTPRAPVTHLCDILFLRFSSFSAVVRVTSFPINGLFLRRTETIRDNTDLQQPL